MSRTVDTTKPFRLLLTGGGTGGHLFPAVAAAQQLKMREPAAAVLFIGTRRKFDSSQLERYGFQVKTIYSKGIKGKKLSSILAALLILPVSLGQAVYQLLKFKPQVVLGVGGYVTGPVVAAAWLLRIPVVIHEQNSIPGITNRTLAGLADTICISMPCSRHYFPAEKTIFTGNPVRSQIISLRDRRPISPEPPTLLVLGGSQGAHSLNMAVVEAIGYDRQRFGRLKIIHQTGSADQAWVTERYQDMAIEADVAAFFDRMELLYEAASLVISRAGATTLAELAVVGIPAILIPYPHAADNHQELNARQLVENGGGVVMRERELRPETLAKLVRELLDSAAERQRMSAAIKSFGVADAAHRIIDACLHAGRK